MKALAPSVGVHLFEFGPFVADPVKGLLRQSGVAVPLTPKAFEVLMALIEHRGQVVGKDDLLAHVWPDTAVEESNLVQHISMLRKALNDQRTEHRYIVTVPGRGYRFVADVREVAGGHGGPAGQAIGAFAARSDAAATVTQYSERAPDAISFDQRLPVAGRRPASRLWMLPAIMTVVALAFLAVRLGSRPRAIQPPQRALWQVTFDPGLERDPTWSPDGRWIAYDSDRTGNADIWVHPIGHGDPIRLTTSPADDGQPDWSPDGQRLAFRSERDGGGLFVVPAFGGAVRKVADFGYQPRWSPDGSQILFLSSSLDNVREAPKVYLLGLNGSPPRAVLADALADFAWPRVIWHPDGRRVSLWGRHQRWGWSFWTVPLAGGPPVKSGLSAEVERRLGNADVSVTNLLWSLSGRALYFEGVSQGVTSLWRVTVDPLTLRWIGGPDRLTTGAGLDEDPSLSADGKRVAFSIRRERTRLWSLPFDPATGHLTGPGQPVTADSGDASFPDLSSDGKRLVYRMVRGTRQELWERSLEDGRDRLLVAGGGFLLMDPLWSPDGSWLTYRRLRDFTARGPSPSSVVMLSVDRDEERLLTTPGTRVTASDWSSDGAWMVGECAHGVPERASVCLFPVSSAPHAERHLRMVASHPEVNLWQARFSPDSRWISFNAIDPTEAGASAIYAVPVSGGQWTAVTDGKWFDDKPRWAPDGRMVYFVSNRTGFFNVWGRRFDPARGTPVGEPFQVTRFASPALQMVSQSLGLAVARDRLVLAVTSLSGELWILDNVDR